MTDARIFFKKDESLKQRLAKTLAEGNKDPRKFCAEEVWITDKEGVERTLVFNHSQDKFYQVVLYLQINGKLIRIVVLKSRQVGISTAASGLIYARTYTRPNTNSLIIGHHKEATTNLFNKQRYMYDHMRDELKVQLARENKQELYCKELNWRIALSTAGTVAGTRSNTIHNLLYTEAAFYDHFFALKKATEAGVPRSPVTMVVFETTANGMGTEFHKFWQEAEAGENAYYPLFLNWKDDPECSLPPFLNAEIQDMVLSPLFEKFPDLIERQKAFGLTPEQIGWYGTLLKENYDSDEEIMQQEFPNSSTEAFLTSGKPLVPVKYVQPLLRSAREGELYDPTQKWTTFDDLKSAPYIRRNQDPYIEIYRPPTPGRHYLIPADSAAGSTGSDYSCGLVLDIASSCTVAQLHGRIEFEEFATYLAKLGKYYNNALIVPELDGMGVAVLQALKRKYAHIYQQRKQEGFIEKLTTKLGWETNPETRPVILANMRRIFTDRFNDPDWMPDKMVLNEILTFVNNNGKPQAADGFHDDRVMTLAIGLWACLQEIKIRPQILVSTSTTANSILKPKLSIEDTIRLIKSPDWYGQPLDQLAASVINAPFNTGDIDPW